MQMEHKVVERGGGGGWGGEKRAERAKTGATDERGERKTWGAGEGRATDGRERGRRVNQSKVVQTH